MSTIHDRESELNLLTYRRVAVVGVGGVGSWVAYLLGLSKHVQILYLIDPDTVEISNLNRTPYRESDIGKPKVVALTEIIKQARDITVVPIQDRSENIDIDVDYVIDCRDFLGDDIPSQIVGGYDGKSMTIHFQPTREKIWEITNQHGYTVPSYIVPPVLLASIIVDYIINKDVEVLQEKIITFTMRDLYEKLFGVQPHIREQIETLDLVDGTQLIFERASPQFIKVKHTVGESTIETYSITNYDYRILKKLKDKELNVLNYLDKIKYNVPHVVDDKVYTSGSTIWRLIE